MLANAKQTTQSIEVEAALTLMMKFTGEDTPFA
jgi:hypothetical protein